MAFDVRIGKLDDKLREFTENISSTSKYGKIEDVEYCFEKHMLHSKDKVLWTEMYYEPEHSRTKITKEKAFYWLNRSWQGPIVWKKPNSERNKVKIHHKLSSDFFCLNKIISPKYKTCGRVGREGVGRGKQ